MPSTVDAPWSIDYLVAADRNPAVVAAERVEQLVFADSHGVSPEMWAEEFSPYDDRTVWIAISHRDRIVGTMRAVVGPLEGLKIASDLPRFWDVSLPDALNRHGLAPDLSYIEATTLTVLPEARSIDRWWALRALTAGFVHFVVDSGATHVLKATAPDVLRILQIVMPGCLFEAIDGLGVVDWEGPMQPFVSSAVGYIESVDTKDQEHQRLVVNRDLSGRGGTKLPPIDLTDGSPLALHRRLCGAPVLGALS